VGYERRKIHSKKDTKVNVFILAIVIFIVAILIIELIFYSAANIRNPDRAKIRKKLKTISTSRQVDGLPNLMRKRVLSDVPLLNEILLRITGIHRLDRLRYQANTSFPSGFFVLLSLFFVGLGFLVFYLLVKIGLLLSVISGGLCGTLPILYLNIKKKRRMKKYQAQLPEALDMMARSLRAGHAFSTGMKLAADEFDDPLGPEFSITIDEINFGLGVPEALKNLVSRVDCLDLNFFVVAVILQRETGGNLADVMENIAYLIRERFKFYGKVRALAAEGKLSMIILISLPFFIVGTLLVLNPKYIMLLFTDPAGRIMCAVAVIMMIIGGFVMRRIIDIEV
jgi:tight adherence protein B